MKAADLFVKALEQEGVEKIFGVPGEENLDLLDAISRSSIELVLTRHEQSAGFMAATFGRLTGKTGVCLSTLGPGATNLVTAAAYAQLGGMPMLMITGQKPIKKSKQGQFQIIDVIGMMKPITKMTKQIVNGYHIPSLVREAFRLSMTERPGAVHLELPEDIAAEECNAPLFAIQPLERPHASHNVLQVAATMIEQAQRPLLLIGAGANRKQTSIALNNFVDASQIPFLNTQMGKGVIDERHDLYLGTAAISEGDFLHLAIEQADLIINVGHDIIEKPPFVMKHGATTNVIHINFSPAVLDDVYFPNLEVVGDITNSIEQLNTLIKPSAHWDFSRYHSIQAALADYYQEACALKPFPILPQCLVHEVRSALPDDGILTLDNGMYKIWFARNYHAHQANGLLLDNALATMGAGLPSAIAAKMLYPQRKVIALCGDGGFMMNAHELETAVRKQLALTIIILTDNAYGMIKWKQSSMDLANFGLDFNNPDFVTFAQAFGAQGYRISEQQPLAPILAQCLANDKVNIIDIPMDYSQNHIALGEQLSKHVNQLKTHLDQQV